MEENQHGCAQHGKNAEQQRHARRQRGCGNQYRPEQQEGKRILQTAREIKQRRKLGNVEAEEIGGAFGLEPLCVRETDAKRDVEQSRKRDHR